MAFTAFSELNSQQKVLWSRVVWKAARDQAFITKFTGSGYNNVIHRITELTKTEKGDQMLFQLVADLTSDGVSNPTDNSDLPMAFAPKWSGSLSATGLPARIGAGSGRRALSSASTSAGVR